MIADNVTIFNHSVITEATIGSGSHIGPFARLRPRSDIGERVHIGNFVEIKKSELGVGTKVGHLSYIGDATVGAGVNIGAGTITCNYDGQRKHQTVIGDGAFVGSDSTLVAPVIVGSDAYVAAGSSITHDVPSGGWGIARGRQTNKPGWVTAGRAAKHQTPVKPDESENRDMCGIIGYIGPRPVVPLIIEGLRKLEYRGYDSAGHRRGVGNGVLVDPP